MTPTASCAHGAALSWLLLERLELGELAADERARVDAHLASCDGCRSCLESLRADASALPPLALPPRRAPLPRRARWRRGWVLAAASVAAAAAVAAILLSSRAIVDNAPPARLAWKGGELALELVRERAGETLVGARSFAPGDRWKALCTCPPGERVVGELWVWQAGEASFPLPRVARPLACGNLVPLAGAFELTGREPALVCLTVGATLPQRRALARGPRPLPPGTVCVALEPGG